MIDDHHQQQKPSKDIELDKSFHLVLNPIARGGTVKFIPLFLDQSTL
jgi:hypothetical protein